MDSRAVIDACSQAVIQVDDEKVVYANSACEKFLSFCAEGKTVSELFNGLTSSLLSPGNICICRNEPVHIDNIITDEKQRIIFFTPMKLEFDKKKYFLENKNMFLFSAIAGGTFTFATKSVYKLLGIDSQEMLQNDGWSQLSNIFSDLTLSRNTVHKMFSKENRGFLTTVKAGQYEGTKIYWSTVVNSDNPESTQILAMGIRIPEEVVEDARYDVTFEVDDLLESVHLPLVVFSSDGIEFMNLINRYDLKNRPEKTSLRDKISELITNDTTVDLIENLISDVSSGIDRNISITANVKTGINTVSQLVFSVLPVRYKRKRCILLLGAPFGGYIRQSHELRKKRNLLELYESIHETISDDVTIYQALQRILEVIYEKFGCECVEIHTQDDQKIDNIKIYGKRESVSKVELGVLDKTYKTNTVQVSNNISDKNCSIVVPFSNSPTKNNDIFAIITLRDANQETIEEVCKAANFARVAISQISLREDYSEKKKIIDEMGTFIMELQNALNHDMKTPLTSIIGYSELLMQGILDSESEKNQAHKSVVDAAKNLEEQINELAGTTKKLKKISRVNLCKVNVNKFIKEISSLMVPFYESKMIEFELVLPDSIIKALIDYDKFKISILSVLQNAADFSPMGGNVECVLKKLSDDFFQLTVSDNGPGIQNKRKNTIFRKSNKTKSADKSKGLSLHNSMLNIKAMNGRIWFESPGELGGTTFYIVLPSITD